MQKQIQTFNIGKKRFFFAKGNAIIYLSDATLRGDLIKYDLQNKLLTVVGNVIFEKGEQYFEASKLSYDLRKDTGYIDNDLRNQFYKNSKYFLYPLGSLAIANNPTVICIVIIPCITHCITLKIQIHKD